MMFFKLVLSLCVALNVVLAADYVLEWEDAPPQVSMYASDISPAKSAAMASKLQKSGVGSVFWQPMCGKSIACSDDHIGPCANKPYRRRKLLDAIKDGVVSCDSEHSMQEKEKRQFKMEEVEAGKELFYPHMYDHATPSFVRFLPQSVSELVPFSMEDLPTVYKAFRIESSRLMSSMVGSLKSCKAPASAVEHKACATSMKQMRDFITKHLGTNPLQVSSSQDSSFIQGPVKVMHKELMLSSTTKHVSCHKLMYAYLVYYCHTVSNTEVYKVNLQNELNQATATVFMECHQHKGFCHFTSSTDLVFVAK